MWPKEGFPAPIAGTILSQNARRCHGKSIGKRIRSLGPILIWSLVETFLIVFSPRGTGKKPPNSQSRTSQGGELSQGTATATAAHQNASSLRESPYSYAAGDAADEAMTRGTSMAPPSQPARAAYTQRSTSAGDNIDGETGDPSTAALGAPDADDILPDDSSLSYIGRSLMFDKTGAL